MAVIRAFLHEVVPAWLFKAYVGCLRVRGNLVLRIVLKGKHRPLFRKPRNFEHLDFPLNPKSNKTCQPQASGFGQRSSVNPKVDPIKKIKTFTSEPQKSTYHASFVMKNSVQHAPTRSDTPKP